MEKLDKLLLEFYNWYINRYDIRDLEYLELKLIKELAERLIKNDTIDIYKLKHKFYEDVFYVEYGASSFICDNTKLLTFMLTIQEKPIEFLVSILK